MKVAEIDIALFCCEGQLTTEVGAWEWVGGGGGREFVIFSDKYKNLVTNSWIFYSRLDL